MRRRDRVAALCALSLGACPNDQPVDPLDPALLAQLAEAGGDGRGEALTGSYLADAEVGACDCPRIMGLDLCAYGSSAFGLDGPLAVIQADGWMTFAPESTGLVWALSGAVDRDGEVVLAGLSKYVVGLFAVRLHGRLDGAFTPEREFVGELTFHLSGELADGPLDCHLEFALSGASVGGA